MTPGESKEMTLEPLASELIPATSCTFIFDKKLSQCTITGLKPLSNRLNLSRGLMTQDVLPHSVHDAGFALIETIYLSAEDAVEVECCLMRPSKQLESVIQADITDEYEELVERMTDFASKVLAGHKK